MSKGLIQQIEKRGNVIPSKILSLKDLNELFSTLQESEIKEKKRLRKNYDNNIKHLTKRSKELKKEVPLGLLMLFTPFSDTYISTEIRNKFKEWL